MHNPQLTETTRLNSINRAVGVKYNNLLVVEGAPGLLCRGCSCLTDLGALHQIHQCHRTLMSDEICHKTVYLMGITMSNEESCPGL